MVGPEHGPVEKHKETLEEKAERVMREHPGLDPVQIAGTPEWKALLQAIFTKKLQDKIAGN